MKPLVNLNYLSYALLQLALILRTNDLYGMLGEKRPFERSYFENIVNITKDYQDLLDKELELWRYCKNSDIVIKPEIDYWDLSSINSTKSSTLFGFVEFILQNVIQT